MKKNNPKSKIALSLILTFLLILGTVTVGFAAVGNGNSGNAGKPDSPGNSENAGRPDSPGNSENAGKPESPGNSENNGNSGNEDNNSNQGNENSKDKNGNGGTTPNPANTPSVQPDAVPSGNGIVPYYQSGNPISSSESFYKIDDMSGNPFDGEYVFAEGKIIITDSTPVSFSWSSEGVVISEIIVKAGDGANIYIYDPAEDSDTGLCSPYNNGSQQANISHIIFGFGEVEEVDDTVIEEDIEDNNDPGNDSNDEENNDPENDPDDEDSNDPENDPDDEENNDPGNDSNDEDNNDPSGNSDEQNEALFVPGEYNVSSPGGDSLQEAIVINYEAPALPNTGVMDNIYFYFAGIFFILLGIKIRRFA